MILALHLRAASRLLRRDPAWVAAVALTLALAMASELATFTVANAVLFRSLPYPRAEGLFMLHDVYKSQQPTPIGVSDPETFDYSDSLRRIATLAAFDTGHANVTLDMPRQLAAAWVSASFFDVVDVQPALGRAFLPEEDRPHAPRVVVLSHRLWQSMSPAAGGQDLAAGSNLVIDGRSCRIVGVMPAGFRFPTDLSADRKSDLIFPLQLDRGHLRTRDNPSLSMIGRLRPGATLGQVARELRHLRVGLRAEYPHLYPLELGFDILAIGLRDEIVGDVAATLLAVLGAAGLVYLAALSNACGLMLTKLDRRRKEVGLRQALGASRRQLLAQLLVESGLITLLACAPGAALALAAWQLVVASGAGRELPRFDAIAPDAHVALFFALLVVATALVLAILPLLHTRRGDELRQALQEESGGATAGKRSELFRALMVVTQVGLSCALLIGATVLLVSQRNLRRIDLGLQPSQVTLLELDLPPTYDTPQKTTAFFAAELSRIRALPGVAAACTLAFVPLADTANVWPVGIDGRKRYPEVPSTPVDVQVVSEGCLRTLAIPLFRGRDLEATDDARHEPAVLVSASLARWLIPGDPVGRRLRPMVSRRAAWARVVGLVGDVRQNTLTGEPRPTLYVAYRQVSAFADFPVSSLTVAARSSLAPSTLAAAVRHEVAALDPTLPVASVRRLGDVVAAATARQRLAADVFGLFAAVAFALTLTGIFSLVAQLMSHRAREVAIRLALGASRRGIVALVLGEGLRLTAAGLLLGLLAAAALSRLLTHLLYGLSGLALGAIYAGAVALVLLAAAAACLAPAWSGANTPPATIMRRG